MIAKRWTRNEILEKLRAKINAKKPLLFSSAGTGLVAKLLEKAGADCVSTFSGARLRNNGWGTMSMLWPMMDANEQVLYYTEHDIITSLKGNAFVVHLSMQMIYCVTSAMS